MSIDQVVAPKRTGGSTLKLTCTCCTTVIKVWRVLLVGLLVNTRESVCFYTLLTLFEAHKLASADIATTDELVFFDALKSKFACTSSFPLQSLNGVVRVTGNT